MKSINLTCFIISISFLLNTSCKKIAIPSSDEWQVDFFDDFHSFDSNNWQDQRIWVNNEIIARVIAPPAEGPSLGTAASGQCICIPQLVLSFQS